jgi:mono/diheme cytochrome c family protein
VGWLPEVHGQPAWPWAHRLAAEVLAQEPQLARQATALLACVLGLGVLALLALRWRWARWALAPALFVVATAAPWSALALLQAPAVPTSWHHSPTGFTVQSIAQGAHIYQQQCVRCHGADGKGEGPDAARLPMWPPTLNGSLLWKRLEGELFWRVRHGMHSAAGVQTMPAFGDLSDAQVWQVLDYLQAHAAGQLLRDTGAWAQPVRMPQAAVHCRNAASTSVRQLQGQRLRVVLGGGVDALPPDDPRLLTLWVPGQADAAGIVGGAADRAECTVQDPQALPVLTWVLGQVADDGKGPQGTQMLVDRNGWLRARAAPGQGGWSEDDLVCRASVPSNAPATRLAASAPPAADGLEALIRRMDAEPVRPRRGGFPH